MQQQQQRLPIQSCKRRRSAFALSRVECDKSLHARYRCLPNPQHAVGWLARSVAAGSVPRSHSRHPPPAARSISSPMNTSGRRAADNRGTKSCLPFVRYTYHSALQGVFLLQQPTVQTNEMDVYVYAIHAYNFVCIPRSRISWCPRFRCRLAP